MPTFPVSFPAAWGASWPATQRKGRGGTTTPLTIFGSALEAWVDFSDISKLSQTADGATPVTADAQTILYAADKSGNGVNFTHATAGGVYKTAGPNGLSVCTFANTNKFLDATLAALSQPFSIFISCSFPDEAQNFAFDSGGANRAALWSDAGKVIEAFAGTGNDTTISAPQATLTYYSLLFNGASSAARQAGVSIEGGGTVGTNTYENPRLGSGNTETLGLGGDVGEFIICSGDQTAKFAAIESYLSRWT